MKCLHEGYGCEDVDRRGFVSLMDLYENNFIRLRKLAPMLSTSAGYAVSSIDGCMDLHLQILERSHYTTTFVLTYYFTDASHGQKAVIAEPQLKCRAYHDAGQVEVLTGHLQHGRQRYDAMPAHAALVKWKLNRFLYKWLGYSLYLGHSFTRFDARPAPLETASASLIVNA